MPYAKIGMVSAVNCVYLEEPIKDHVTVETVSILRTMEGHVLEVCHIFISLYKFYVFLYGSLACHTLKEF